jgi:hypothetical protein
MKQGNLAKFRAASRRCGKVANELEQKAIAFRMIGMHEIGAELEFLAGELDEISVLIEETSSKAIYDGVEAAQQSSQNMLDAALAGVKIGKEKGGD